MFGSNCKISCKSKIVLPELSSGLPEPTPGWLKADLDISTLCGSSLYAGVSLSFSPLGLIGVKSASCCFALYADSLKTLSQDQGVGLDGALHPSGSISIRHLMSS